MKANQGITLLDCTFRDGGYYTNWHFDRELVSQYISLCSKIGINVIELGYLCFNDNKAGTFANIPKSLTDEMVRSLQNHPRLRYAVMIDVKDLKAFHPDQVGKMLHNCFSQTPVPINLLRLAINFKNIQALQPYIASLQAAGFDLCVNLMQIDLASESELENCINILSQFHNLSAIYIADSLGSLHPQKLKNLIHQFKNQITCPIGFHAHDNIGLALHNSLVAIDAGVTWIDSTFYGMGRGAGNAKTEQIYPLIYQNVPTDIQFELFAFTARYFQSLKDRYDWGASALYGISGIARIHPTYLQLLEENTALSVAKKIEILFSLAEMHASHFSIDLLDEATKVYA